MASKGLLSLASLILIAGGLLLMFLILLAGTINHGPVNRYYFVEADTGNIPGAPQISRWTYWNVCPRVGSAIACGNRNYEKVHAAFPFNPPGKSNFNTDVNVPLRFQNTDFYYLMTRFAFAFMLIALFFGVCALFTGLLALCSRIGAYLSGLLTMIAAFFQVLQCALFTAAYVRARDHFRRNGQAAHIGSYAFGFQWAAAACFFISVILFCISGSSRDKTPKSSKTKSSGGGFFGGKGRSKSTRSRGSFIDSNKEYS